MKEKKQIEIKKVKNDKGTTKNYTTVLHCNHMNMIVKILYLA